VVRVCFEHSKAVGTLKNAFAARYRLWVLVISPLEFSDQEPVLCVNRILEVVYACLLQLDLK
jgi:hypothetical protein